MHRGPCDQQFLGIDRQLGPEAAADFGGDHPDRGLGQAEEGRNLVADAVRNLCRRPDCDRRLPAVGDGNHAARLDGHAGQTLVANASPHDTVGTRKRRLDITPDPGRFIGDIRSKALVDKRGARVGRYQRVGDDRTRVELDRDEIGRVARLLPRFRDDEADQVAAEAHPIAVEKGTFREPAALRPAHREGRSALHVDGRDHRDHPGGRAGGGQVDRLNVGVRQIAAHEDQVAEARGAEVIDVGAGTCDQSRVFATAHPRPQAIGERHAPSLRESPCGPDSGRGLTLLRSKVHYVAVRF